MPATRHRVVVADNDAGVRDALADVLDADSRFEVVGRVATAHELPALLDREPADVVLLDVRMPGGGPEAVEMLLERRDPPVVVAVSADTHVATVVAMLRAGAVGFLAKGWIGHTLPEAVCCCVEGQVVLAVPNGAQVLQALMGGHPFPAPVTVHKDPLTP